MPNLPNRRQRNASVDTIRPRTPPSLPSQRVGEQHWPTPTCAAIQEIVRFNDAHAISFSRNTLFRYYRVPQRTDYRIIRESAPYRRLHNDPTRLETRGRKPLIDANSIREMERILQEEGIAARALT